MFFSSFPNLLLACNYFIPYHVEEISFINKPSQMLTNLVKALGHLMRPILLSGDRQDLADDVGRVPSVVGRGRVRVREGGVLDGV